MIRVLKRTVTSDTKRRRYGKEGTARLHELKNYARGMDEDP